MLLRLMVFRLAPVGILVFCKNRKTWKWTVCLLTFCGLLCFGAAVWEILKSGQWRGLFCIPFAVLPQGICYVFAVWLLLRCSWNEWSLRVRKRICTLSVLILFTGVLLENYINPYFLRFFFEFFT